MRSTIATIFHDARNLDEFKAAVLRLGGDFDFDEDEMMELGSLYAERYPACYDDSQYCQEMVHAGYTLVRICVTEQLLREVLPALRGEFRGMFGAIDRIEGSMNSLIASAGIEEVRSQVERMEKRFNAIKFAVDRLPRGIVKERFSGGISSFANLIYIMKLVLSRKTS